MEYEYRDSSHEMWLEGSSDVKPNKQEVIEHANKKGFKLEYFKCWLDTMQGFWRFSADLVILTPNKQH